jgi:hypothetical protein
MNTAIISTVNITPLCMAIKQKVSKVTVLLILNTSESIDHVPADVVKLNFLTALYQLWL